MLTMIKMCVLTLSQILSPTPKNILNRFLRQVNMMGKRVEFKPSSDYFLCKITLKYHLFSIWVDKNISGHVIYHSLITITETLSPEP